LIRIILADDHALFRAGMRAILKEMPDVDVVADVSDGHEALRVVAESMPDLAILDISMPGLNGLEVAARIAREHPATRSIILSMYVDDEYVRRALAVGAAGYLLKTSDRGELEKAVRAAARGDIWLTSEVSSRVAAACARGDGAREQGPVEVLTARQREVLQMIAEGLTGKEIAQRLDLSVKTIESHRTELMRRLDAHSVAGLVRYAVRVGIVRSGPG
jgi:DNA-binding NarL/FixJ family response regulator